MPVDVQGQVDELASRLRRIESGDGDNPFGAQDSVQYVRSTPVFGGTAPAVVMTVISQTDTLRPDPILGDLYRVIWAGEAENVGVVNRVCALGIEILGGVNTVTAFFNVPDGTVVPFYITHMLTITAGGAAGQYIMASHGAIAFGTIPPFVMLAVPNDNLVAPIVALTAVSDVFTLNFTVVTAHLSVERIGHYTPDPLQIAG